MSNVGQIPQLRFPEFTGEWQEKRLGEVAMFLRGSGVSKSDIVDNGNREAIRYGELYTVYNEKVSLVKSRINGSPRDTLSNKNDVILPSSGETAIDISTATFVGKGGVALGGDLNIVRTQESGLFLSYYLNHRKRYDIAKLAQGISVVHLYASDLKTLQIQLPIMEEQQKIAAFLATVDKRVALLEHKVQQLEAYKRGVIQQLFSQQLRFTRPDGSHFPVWQEKRLGEIGEIITGKTPATSNKSLWGGTIDFITPSDIDDGKYQKPTERTLAEISNLRVLPPGSISFTCIASIGKMSITKRPSVTNQQINSIITRQCIDNEYLYYCLLNMTPRIRATQANTTLPIINKADFSGFKVRVPCMAEQQKIATFLSALDEKIALTRQQLDKTKQFKKGLLQRMFV